MIDISVIIQGLQIGEVVSNWLNRLFYVKHLDEMSQGFECLKKAECMEDIKMAYSHFKKVDENDKIIVHVCSLYGRAICLPFFQEYDAAVSCVEKLKGLQYIKRPGYLGGTWFYQKIEGFQAECDNLLALIEEVRKKYEPEPELEPIPNNKYSWVKIGICAFAALLMVALGFVLAFVFFP